MLNEEIQIITDIATACARECFEFFKVDLTIEIEEGGTPRAWEAPSGDVDFFIAELGNQPTQAQWDVFDSAYSDELCRLIESLQDELVE